jgi:hypothetical protein
VRYYLDTEFDGAGGPLLTLALVREDGASLYLHHDFEPMDIWVQRNVKPLIADCPEPPVTSWDREALAGALADFIRDDPAPVIVADWLADISHCCDLLRAGSLYWSDPQGHLGDIPPLRFEVSNVDAYPTTLPGAVQHNAWWDAMALREKLCPAQVRESDSLSRGATAPEAAGMPDAGPGMKNPTQEGQSHEQ